MRRVANCYIRLLYLLYFLFHSVYFYPGRVGSPVHRVGSGHGSVSLTRFHLCGFPQEVGTPGSNGPRCLGDCVVTCASGQRQSVVACVARFILYLAERGDARPRLRQLAAAASDVARSAVDAVIVRTRRGGVRRRRLKRVSERNETKIDVDDDLVALVA